MVNNIKIFNKVHIIQNYYTNSLILFNTFFNSNFKPDHAADCEAHLSRSGATKAKDIAKKRKALKQLEKTEKLN